MILWSSLLALLLTSSGDLDAGMRRCAVRYELCVNDCHSEEDTKQFIGCRTVCNVTYNGCITEVQEAIPSTS